MLTAEAAPRRLSPEAPELLGGLTADVRGTYLMRIMYIMLNYGSTALPEEREFARRASRTIEIEERHHQLANISTTQSLLSLQADYMTAR